MIYQILVVASQEVAALQLNHDQLCTDQAPGELAEPLNMVEFTLKKHGEYCCQPMVGRSYSVRKQKLLCAKHNYIGVEHDNSIFTVKF
jgi:hypothetical protein